MAAAALLVLAIGGVAALQWSGISNLDRASNLDVASVMAPVVYSHLHRLEL